MAKKDSKTDKNSKSDDVSRDSAKSPEKCLSPSELQARYLQFEMMNRELEQFEAQRQVLDMKTKELKVLRESMDSVIEGEGFSQLGEGFYVPSKFTDSNTYLVDIGMKIFVKMNKNDAKKYLDKKVREFDDVLKKIDDHRNCLMEELQRQAMELQGI